MANPFTNKEITIFYSPTDKGGAANGTAAEKAKTAEAAKREGLTPETALTGDPGTIEKIIDKVMNEGKERYITYREVVFLLHPETRTIEIAKPIPESASRDRFTAWLISFAIFHGMSLYFPNDVLSILSKR